MRDLLIATGGRCFDISVDAIVSLVVVIWLIAAAGRAPHLPLW
ncbi:hypothetical protein [Silicimonas algicola]